MYHETITVLWVLLFIKSQQNPDIAKYWEKKYSSRTTANLSKHSWSEDFCSLRSDSQYLLIVYGRVRAPSIKWWMTIYRDIQAMPCTSRMVTCSHPSCDGWCTWCTVVHREHHNEPMPMPVIICSGAFDCQMFLGICKRIICCALLVYTQSFSFLYMTYWERVVMLKNMMLMVLMMGLILPSSFLINESLFTHVPATRHQRQSHCSYRSIHPMLHACSLPRSKGLFYILFFF